MEQRSLWRLQSSLSPTLDIRWNQSSKCYLVCCKHRLFDLSCMSLNPGKTCPISRWSRKKNKTSQSHHSEWWREKDTPGLLSAELLQPGHHLLSHLVALRLAGHLRLEHLLLPGGTEQFNIQNKGLRTANKH